MVKHSETILHICQRSDWLTAKEVGSYLADSLETEGFIHCSRVEQVAKVANAYYRGVEDLVLLHIAADKLWAELKWEDSDGDIFPHVYGPINLDAVTRVGKFSPGESGNFSYP